MNTVLVYIRATVYTMNLFRSAWLRSFYGQLRESARTTICFLTDYGIMGQTVYREKENNIKEGRKRKRTRKRRRRRKKRERDTGRGRK